MKASSKDWQNLAQNLEVAISPFFSAKELDQLARESGFVQRQSKLTGSLFLNWVVFNAENLKSQSLNDLSIILNAEHQVELTKQSLHERFNENAVIFLRQALEQRLSQQLDGTLHLPEFEGINRILIKDSVCFQIDSSLFDHYPGSGGSASTASVRIQFEYDIKKGAINDLSLNAFNDQDAKDAITTVDLINKDDLIIRDLAYVGLDALKGIVERHAHYLCRLSPTVKVYERKGDEYVELDFVVIRRHLQNTGMTMMEKTVFLGKDEKFRTRLILHLMPEAEVNERLRKARKNAKKKGRGDLTAEYIARAHLNLFITNTKTSIIPTNQVWNLYRLRWQIELMFKIWKSICDIEKVKKVKKTRLECYIYSKLILIVLGWQILWAISRHLYQMEGKSMSFYKAFKTLITIKLQDLRNVFSSNRGSSLVEFMVKFYELSQKSHLLEKKKGKPLSIELLVGLLTCSFH